MNSATRGRSTPDEDLLRTDGPACDRRNGGPAPRLSGYRRRLDGHRTAGRIRTRRQRRDDAQRPPAHCRWRPRPLLGLAVAIGSAALFGRSSGTAGLSPDTPSHDSPADRPACFTGGSLARGRPGAGAAGAFGLATALPVSLVGVMIAAALIPAAAAIGVGSPGDCRPSHLGRVCCWQRRVNQPHRRSRPLGARSPSARLGG